MAARFGRLPVLTRIGVLILGGMMLLLCAFVLIGSSMAAERAGEMAAERLEVAELTAEFLDHELDEQFAILELAAGDVGHSDLPSPRDFDLADVVHSADPYVTGVRLVDAQGQVLSAYPPVVQHEADMSGHPAVIHVLAMGGRYASGALEVGPQGGSLVDLAVPVLAPDGAHRGVMLAHVDFHTAAFRLVQRAARQLGASGHVELFDQKMRLISSSAPIPPSGLAEHASFYGPLLQAHVHEVGLTGPIDNRALSDQGQRHVMAFVPLKSAPWGVAVGGAEPAFTQLADRWRWQAIALGFVGLVIVALLSWANWRSIVAPVRTLTQSSRRLAAGDLRTLVPLTGDGEVRTLSEALDDMRARLRDALESLAIEKSRYQAIVESMADGVVTTNLQSHITAFNPAAAALTGWRIEDAVGRTWTDVLQPMEPPNDAHRELAQSADAASGPSIIKQVVYRCDGRPTVLAEVRAPIQGRDGAPEGTVHVLRDVSAEQELSDLKEQFLSTVSHELRTPIGLIVGYATTLLTSPNAVTDSELIRRCLQEIVGASEELRELVDNLLDMSSIGAGALTIDPRRFQIGPLAAVALKRVRVRAAGHHLRLDMSSGLPAVYADPHRVKQVLYNLLDNAVKYTPAGGHITVSAEISNDELIVSVADDGPGLPPQEISRMFERFYRGAVARTLAMGGNGLGLPISKGIVEAQGGRIWAESAVSGTRNGATSSHGTALRFTLPLALHVHRARRNSDAYRASHPGRMDSRAVNGRLDGAG